LEALLALLVLLALRREVLEALLALLGYLSLWGEVLEGWRAGAAVGFDPLAMLLEALRKVFEALYGFGGWSALLALWGEREVFEGWSRFSGWGRWCGWGRWSV